MYQRRPRSDIRVGMQAAPLLKDLVLVGGGHSHVHVLKSFGMKPMPGVRLTLIGRDIETPYSGMIPGFVAGHYTFDECHIDLARLAAWTGARLIHAEATGIDRANRQVLLKDRPAVSYDLLSIDVGSAPTLDTIPGAAQWATPVKPIAELGRRWLAFLDSRRSWLGPLNIVVIGGGAGGVELALAIDHRLRDVAKGAQVQVTLVTKNEILSGQADAARRKMRAIFAPARRAAAGERSDEPDRARRRAARERQVAGGGLGVRRHRGERRQVVRHDRPAARRARLHRRRRHAALDRRRADLRRRRLRHGVEASAAQGRRVRGAPGPAAGREPAARPAGPGAAALHAAKPLPLDHRHRRRSCRRHPQRVGDRGCAGCGAGRTISTASGCACIASRRPGRCRWRPPLHPIRRWPTPKPGACSPTSACAAAAAAPRWARACCRACWRGSAPRPAQV